MIHTSRFVVSCELLAVFQLFYGTNLVFIKKDSDSKAYKRGNDYTAPKKYRVCSNKRISSKVIVSQFACKKKFRWNCIITNNTTTPKVSSAVWWSTLFSFACIRFPLCLKNLSPYFQGTKKQSIFIDRLLFLLKNIKNVNELITRNYTYSNGLIAQ